MRQKPTQIAILYNALPLYCIPNQLNQLAHSTLHWYYFNNVYLTFPRTTFHFQRSNPSSVGPFSEKGSERQAPRKLFSQPFLSNFFILLFFCPVFPQKVHIVRRVHRDCDLHHLHHAADPAEGGHRRWDAAVAVAHRANLLHERLGR